MSRAPGVHLAHAEPIPLAVVRRRARRSELSAVVPQACGFVWEFLRSHELRGGRNVAVYLNGAIDIEVGVEFAHAIPEHAQVVRSSTPAALTASTIHYGPYQALGATAIVDAEAPR